MTDQQLNTLREKHEFWQQHIDQWAHSGLSQSEYRRRNHLNKSRWGYWNKRLTGPMPPTANLVPVTIPSCSASSVRVIVDDRFIIEVPADFDPETFSKVISCLTRQ